MRVDAGLHGMRDTVLALPWRPGARRCVATRRLPQARARRRGPSAGDDAARGRSTLSREGLPAVGERLGERARRGPPRPHASAQRGRRRTTRSSGRRPGTGAHARKLAREPGGGGAAVEDAGEDLGRCGPADRGGAPGEPELDAQDARHGGPRQDEQAQLVGVSPWPAARAPTGETRSAGTASERRGRRARATGAAARAPSGGSWEARPVTQQRDEERGVEGDEPRGLGIEATREPSGAPPRASRGDHDGEGVGRPRRGRAARRPPPAAARAIARARAASGRFDGRPQRRRQRRQRDARRARRRLPRRSRARRPRPARSPRAPPAGPSGSGRSARGLAPRAAHAAAKAPRLAPHDAARRGAPARRGPPPATPRARGRAPAAASPPRRRAAGRPPASAERRGSTRTVHTGASPRATWGRTSSSTSRPGSRDSCATAASSTAPVSATMGCGASGAAGKSKTVRAASKPSVATGRRPGQPPGARRRARARAARRGRRCQRTSNVKLPRISARGSSTVMRTVLSSRRAACASSERPSSAVMATSGSRSRPPGRRGRGRST